jgi:hypothetical protein
MQCHPATHNIRQLIQTFFIDFLVSLSADFFFIFGMKEILDCVSAIDDDIVGRRAKNHLFTLELYIVSFGRIDNLPSRTSHCIKTTIYLFNCVPLSIWM